MNKSLNENINRIKSILKEGEPNTVRMVEPVDMGKSKHNFWQIRNKGKFGYKGGGTYNHKGTDISVPSGTIVKSPLDGVVTLADFNHNNSCGATLDIDHGNDLVTRFCHMSRIDVNKGQFVKIGEVVGLSGGLINAPGSGNSKGPHLHWTLIKKSGGPIPFADPDKIVNTEVPVGDFTGMGIVSTSSTGPMSTTSTVTDNTTLGNQDDEKKLLEKIKKSEYLGMTVEDWVKVKDDPFMVFKLLFKPFNW